MIAGYQKLQQLSTFKLQGFTLVYKDYRTIDIKEDQFISQSYTSVNEPFNSFDIKSFIQKFENEKIRYEDVRQIREAIREDNEQTRSDAELMRTNSTAEREKTFSDYQDTIDEKTSDLNRLDEDINNKGLFRRIYQDVERRVKTVDSKTDSVLQNATSILVSSVNKVKAPITLETTTITQKFNNNSLELQSIER